LKIIEKVANVSVILAVAVFLVLVARGELAKRHPPNLSPDALLGKMVTLPGVTFPQGRNALVLALSTSCHFCEQSLPFYKDLTEKSNGRFDVIALLPQPEPEARSFIERASVKPTRVVSARLDTIGVNATPTILVVDNTGKVKSAWIGLLDETAQQKLMADALAR
jgi:thioredoxin-related protein